MDNTLSTPLRVLVAGNDTLMDEFLHDLLLAETDLQVTSVFFNNEKSFIENVLRVAPDVIVCNRASRVDFPGLFGELGNLLGPKNLKMIVVGVDSNAVDVYEKRQAFRLHSDEFINLLERPPAAHPALE